MNLSLAERAHRLAEPRAAISHDAGRAVVQGVGTEAG